jgi:hypothetical protein
LEFIRKACVLALIASLAEELFVKRAKRPVAPSDGEILSPFKAAEWLELKPAERLRRSWALRRRLPDIRAVHDRKLFPKP